MMAVRYDQCTYRDCESLPTTVLHGRQGSLPWLACDEHLDAMRKALGVGMNASDGVSEADLSAAQTAGG